jgi:hypothetical protein
MFDIINQINQINQFEDKEIHQAIITSLEQQNLIKKKIELIISFKKLETIKE